MSAEVDNELSDQTVSKLMVNSCTYSGRQESDLRVSLSLSHTHARACVCYPAD